MVEERNAFDALCELAAKEQWCWTINCTTCGHMYFRYGLMQLVYGKHPDHPSWLVTKNDPILYRGGEPTALGQLPPIGLWPEAEQRELASVLAEASLRNIVTQAPFPDWLGYLGLGLLYTEDVEKTGRTLTSAWVPQIIEMLPYQSMVRSHLQLILGDPSQVLGWRHLEEVESELESISNARQKDKLGYGPCK